MQAPAPRKLNSRSAEYGQFLLQPIPTCIRIQYLRKKKMISKLHGGEDTAAYTNKYYPIEGILWNGYNSNTS